MKIQSTQQPSSDAGSDSDAKVDKADQGTNRKNNAKMAETEQLQNSNAFLIPPIQAIPYSYTITSTTKGSNSDLLLSIFT